MTLANLHTHTHTGPVCFAVLLGVSMMLEGKMHFGHIYGMNCPPPSSQPPFSTAYGVTASLLIYGLLNLMSDRSVGLQFTLSILGYNLLPLCFLSFISSLGWLLLSARGVMVYITCIFFIAWSASCSTQVRPPPPPPSPAHTLKHMHFQLWLRGSFPRVASSPLTHTRTHLQMFVVGLSMQQQRWLLFYPLVLFYATFALISIF